MTIEEAKKLLEMNNIFLGKKNIKIKNTIFNKNEYLSKCANYILNLYDNNYVNKKQFDLRLEIIYALFLLNLSEFSYFGIILPMIAFLLIGLISFSLAAFFQNSANFGLDANFQKVGIILYFLGSFFALLFFVILIGQIFNKKYCLFCQKNSSPRYYHVDNKKIKSICASMKDKIYAKSLVFSDLTSERLVINELKTNDFNDYFAILKDEEVHKYLFSKPFLSEDEAYAAIQQEINNYNYGFFTKLAIRLKENNELIGYIGLSKMDLSKKTCQIIYALGKKYWKNGYMTEAVTAFLDKLKALGYEIIIVGHIEGNEKSANVIKKAGFIRYPSKDYTINRNNNTYKIISYILEIKKDEAI